MEHPTNQKETVLHHCRSPEPCHFQLYLSIVLRDPEPFSPSNKLNGKTNAIYI